MDLNFQFSKAENESDWKCSVECAYFMSSIFVFRLAHEVVNGNIVSAKAPTRKEAQHDCALLACELLDSAGILREFMTRSKKRTLAENDYLEDVSPFFHVLELFFRMKIHSLIELGK